MAELLIKIGDQPNGKLLDNDIVHVWNDAAIVREWIQAERHSSEWSVGKDHRFYPLSDDMLKEFLAVRVSDFDDATAELLESPERDEKDVKVQKRFYQFNRQQFATDNGLSNATIEDKDVVVDTRSVVTADRAVYVSQKASVLSG